VYPATVVINFGFAALVAFTLAGNPLSAFANDRILDARWSLNPAGQLQLMFDPLSNGQSEYGETYTVILNDRAPKMCGDPDGTGRHTWFFTDALLIEVMPVRSQPTPMYPSSPSKGGE
jgi:hypothetical protein